MKPGFQYEEIVNGQRGIVSVASDTRLSAINHTRTLYDLLLPFFDNEIEEQLKTLFQKMKTEQDENFQKYLDAGDKPIERRIAIAIKSYPQSQLGNFFKEHSLSLKVEHYREMFQYLLLLYKRRHELSGKRTVGYDTK